MRITNLTGGSRVYTCNVYLVRGDWNGLQDVNTLVDVGWDAGLEQALESLSTGVGKRKVDQVLLTHSHSDHAGMLQAVRRAYGPVVRACSTSLSGVDARLRHGQWLTMGDCEFEVIHTPGHSQDSVCFFCPEEGVLFSGDTPLCIQDSQGDYDQDFLLALQRLAEREVRVVYPGHGPAIQEQAAAMIRGSAERVRRALERGSIQDGRSRDGLAATAGGSIHG